MRRRPLGYVVRHRTTGALLGIPNQHTGGLSAVACWPTWAQASRGLTRRYRTGAISSHPREWEVLPLARFTNPGRGET